MWSRLKFDIQGLFEEIYNERFPESVFVSDKTTFADLQSAGLQSIVPLVNKLREYGHSDDNIRSRVFAFMENYVYLNYVMVKYSDLPVTFDIYKESIDMKFDVLVGNDPYQQKVGPRKTESLWNKFFFKRMSLLKEGGYLSLIHPSGWRNVDGKYKDVQEEIKSKNLLFLSINSVEDGQKLFNATTPFDWYVLQNKKYDGVTTIKFQDGSINQTNISNLEYIPNDNFDTVVSLISQTDEKTVEVIHSYSNYETRQGWISKVQSDEFPYPVVYSVLSDGTVNFMYSSTNDKGHFGIPKLILGNGANPTCFIDYNGEYGMTQFAYGIVDTVENLEKIKEVITSDEFQKVNLATKYVATAGNPLIYPKIAKTFRKDFWKEFINE